jgi:hypothetical protein
MKKLILIVCFFLCVNLLKAQDITGIVTGTTFNYQMISNTQHNFTFHTYFNLGYQSTCPTLINPTFSIVDNTLYVRGYYDVTGPWPAVNCASFDTVVYNFQIPSNVTHIITSTNVIAPNNTPPYVPIILTYENVYTHDFDLSLSNNEFTINKVKLFPNPTNGIINISTDAKYDKIIIYNSLGQILKTLAKSATNTYEVTELPIGLYNLIYFNENNLKIGNSKLLKI